MRVENSMSVTALGSNQKPESIAQSGSTVDESVSSEHMGNQQAQSAFQTEDLPRVVDLANKLTIDLMDPRKIEFKMHQDSGRMMVVVSDRVTGDVVREIPPKDFLDFVAAMDKFVGLLFDRKV